MVLRRQAPKETMSGMDAMPVHPAADPLPLQREPSPGFGRGLTVETVLYALILILAVATRFAMLDSQAMHHDEGIHALHGWYIYSGTSAYVHNAVYHGPFIYHANALAFFLFGDTDVTARLMPALFSVGTVMLPLLLRRQLGRWGALLASTLLLISPSFLYFGRFARNDVFGAFWTLLLFVCLVRYLEQGRSGWLYGAAAALSLYFCTKETAYIAAATFGLFLLGRLLWQRFSVHAFWPLLGILPAAVEDLWRGFSSPAETLPAAPLPLTPPAGGEEAASTPSLLASLSPLSQIALGLAGLALLAMLAWCWWEGRGNRRSPDPAHEGRRRTLDLVVLLGTMVLPLLSAIPLNLLVRLRGLEPIVYDSPDIPEGAVLMGVVAIAFTFAVAAAIGLVWDARRWAISAALFWGIFFVLHTSFFSSMTGWATGLVQALGFWLSQQEEKRIHIGPQYYLIQLPVYELVSFVIGWVGAAFFTWRGLARILPRRSGEKKPARRPAPALGAPVGLATGMLAWWAPVSFVVYSYAGEQVPWLNLHPALPFVLLAAALMGRVLAYRPRRAVSARRLAWADGLLLPCAGLLLAWAGLPLFRDGSPLSLKLAWGIVALLIFGAAWLAFQGLDRRVRGPLGYTALGVVVVAAVVIQANTFSFAGEYDQWRWLYVPLALGLAALIGRAALLGKAALRTGVLLLFVVLCLYGAGSAWRAAYINNDTPVEALVYVQTSSDLQWVADEIAALSTLLTGGNDLVFLYDSEIAWPMEWYARNYPQRSYQPTIAGLPPEDAAMAMVSRPSEETSAPYLENRFYPIRYYAFNWWFPEEYIKNARSFVQWADPELLEGVTTATWREVLRSLTRPSGQAHVWRYFLFREPPAALGAREFATYVRRDLLAPLEWMREAIPRR